MQIFNIFNQQEHTSTEHTVGEPDCDWTPITYVHTYVNKVTRKRSTQTKVVWTSNQAFINEMKLTETTND